MKEAARRPYLFVRRPEAIHPMLVMSKPTKMGIKARTQKAAAVTSVLKMA
jgi:hypothetical protein